MGDYKLIKILPFYFLFNFFMQCPYFQFRFKVNHVILFRSVPVFFLLTILTHHNDRCLQGCQTRQYQI